jgi:hypothetical protein
MTLSPHVSSKLKTAVQEWAVETGNPVWGAVTVDTLVPVRLAPSLWLWCFWSTLTARSSPSRLTRCHCRLMGQDRKPRWESAMPFPPVSRFSGTLSRTGATIKGSCEISRMPFWVSRCLPIHVPILIIRGPQGVGIPRRSGVGAVHRPVRLGQTACKTPFRRGETGLVQRGGPRRPAASRRDAFWIAIRRFLSPHW